MHVVHVMLVRKAKQGSSCLIPQSSQKICERLLQQGTDGSKIFDSALAFDLDNVIAAHCQATTVPGLHQISATGP